MLHVLLQYLKILGRGVEGSYMQFRKVLLTAELRIYSEMKSLKAKC